MISILRRAKKRNAKATAQKADAGLGGEVSNTESIHLWAIAVVTDPATHWCRAALVAGLSLVLVALQLLVLAWVIIEASAPACTVHSDCSAGLYCWRFAYSLDQMGARSPIEAGSNTTSARCQDCGFLLSSQETMAWYATNCSAAGAAMTFERYGEITNPRIIELGAAKAWLAPWNEEEYWCASIDYCRVTDYDIGECDHLVLNLATIRNNPSQTVLLAFVALRATHGALPHATPCTSH